MRITLNLILILVAATASLFGADSGACANLLAFHLQGGVVTKAELLGTEATLPAHCRVAATLKPTADSEIKMEIWLPAENWNGKLQANGNGGWSGSINPAVLSTGVKRGYASTMSDLGHEGARASFALGHPEKLVDFGYRAAHEMTIAAKAIVATYYGHAPTRSYWTGCSAGGRSALMEAQRYPTDYDGIVAGAPGLNWTGRAIQSVQMAQAAHKTEESYIPPEKYSIIHAAVLRACDELDGLKDGVLEAPSRCQFDPKELECKGADKSACLTAPQVETARTLYASVKDRRTQKKIFPGFEKGSEMGWSRMAGPKPFEIGQDMFKYVVFKNPDWDYRTFNFASDLDLTAKAEGGMLNAMNPDLHPFLVRGGKLIQYHGWNDQQIAPGTSVDYYQAVLSSTEDKASLSASYRLFMVPGMEHCSGGDGTSTFDALGALEHWVEDGKAPNQIAASRVKAGVVERTRPLCPYPQVAHYKGSGDSNDAANFSCKLP